MATPAPHLLRHTFPVGMLQCNCSILADTASREAMVIDPGDDLPTILAWLTRHQLTLRQIYLTHAHFDHVLAAAALRLATGAPIYLNQQDIPLLNMLHQQPLWVGLPALQPQPHPLAPDGDASHGLSLTAGAWRGEVLSTPGHTPGSTSLYFAHADLLLAGDTLFAGGIGRTDFPGGNAKAILHSIQGTLLALPETTLVVPGHGPTTQIGTEKHTNPFL